MNQHGAGLKALINDIDDEDTHSVTIIDCVHVPLTVCRDKGPPAIEGQKGDTVAKRVLLTAGDAHGGAKKDMNASTIAQQIALLTDGWMKKGTMQTKVFKYGLRLMAKDVVDSIVDEAFHVLELKDKAARYIQLRWVRMSRLLICKQSFNNPRKMVPTSLEARSAARKERRQREQVQSHAKHKTEQSDGSTQKKIRCPSIHSDEILEQKVSYRNPPGNSQRRAEAKQMKIFERFVHGSTLDDRAIKQSTETMPDMGTTSSRCGEGVNTRSKSALDRRQHKVPLKLESTYNTYTRGSLCASRKKHSSTFKTSARMARILQKREDTTIDDEGNDVRIQQAYAMPNNFERLDMEAEELRLPSIFTTERDKENARNFRSASAEPIGRVIQTLVNAPPISKVNEHTSNQTICFHSDLCDRLPESCFAPVIVVSAT
jgi:hypothetical protein